jgi:quaternary ammonium compound-resistance protein SugE
LRPAIDPKRRAAPDSKTSDGVVLKTKGVTGASPRTVRNAGALFRRMADMRHYAFSSRTGCIIRALGTTPCEIHMDGTARRKEFTMNWVYLFLAGVFEIGWAIGLKYTEGFTRPVPTVLTVASMIVSLGLLGLALKELPVGTAYAIWTGIGTVGTALLGIALLGEPATAIRLACIGLIVAGIIGLKVAA